MFIHKIKQRLVEAQPQCGDFFAYVITFAPMGVEIKK
jgi:hypothetical protein